MNARPFSQALAARVTLGALLLVLASNAGLSPSPRGVPLLPAAVAQEDPVKQADLLTKTLANELNTHYPAITATAIPLLGNQFAVHVSGTVDSADQLQHVRSLVEAVAKRHKMDVVLRLDNLKQKTPEKIDPSDSRTVRLHYLRNAERFATVLAALISPEGTPPSRKVVIQSVGADAVLLTGPYERVRSARRFMALLDLPSPGVNLELWGVQISSDDPNQLRSVMEFGRAEIREARQGVRETYHKIQEFARRIKPEPRFREILQDQLGYRSILDIARPLSITDVLIRLLAAENPGQDLPRFANDLTKWLSDQNSPLTAAQRKQAEKARQAQADKVRREGGIGSPDQLPFGRFFLALGLEPHGEQWVEGDKLKHIILFGRTAILHFGLEYLQTVRPSGQSSPYFLQHASGQLEPLLQTGVKALSLDTQDLFMAPTLDVLREKARKTRHIEFAQVGKTSIATLSGTSTEVTSKSVSAFDEVRPLRPGEFAERVAELNKSTGGLAPADLATGGIPVTQLLAAFGALGEDRTLWRELTAGATLKITPTVLRNASSAELNVDVTIGDPQAGTREAGVRPLSRVSQHDVKSKIYVDSLDLFDVSTFANQATVSGGRGYVPLIGPVWQGLFSDVPVIGSLFSWKRRPKTHYHQSLVLVNSAVTPSAMGVAYLYPATGKSPDYKTQLSAVLEYEYALREFTFSVPSPGMTVSSLVAANKYVAEVRREFERRTDQEVEK